MQMAEFKNHVLSILTRDEIALLSPLRPIELHAGDYLLHAGDRVEQVVFPESGVVSLITGIGGGSAIEIAMIGREGSLGSSVVAGNGGATTDLLVQVLSGRSVREGLRPSESSKNSKANSRNQC
jgi:CRP-like cAMP-binding protein